MATRVDVGAITARILDLAARRPEVASGIAELMIRVRYAASRGILPHDTGPVPMLKDLEALVSNGSDPTIMMGVMSRETLKAIRNAEVSGWAA